jgi:hypothetical protein
MTEHEQAVYDIAVLIFEVIAILKEQKVQLCSGIPSDKNVIDMIKKDSVDALNNLHEFMDRNATSSDMSADLIEILEQELENLERFKTE